MRGVFAAVVDVFVTFAGVAVVAALLVATLDVRANRVAAQLYARQLNVPDQTACPSAAGAGFWFSCASEVRRLHPAPATDKGSAVARAAAIPQPQSTP